MLTELNGHPNKEELTDAPRAPGVTNAPTVAVVNPDPMELVQTAFALRPLIPMATPPLHIGIRKAATVSEQTGALCRKLEII